MDIVDIHSHVLPGVDDGSVSVDETIAMLRLAYDSGTRKIVATPHMFLDLFGNNDFVQIQDHFGQLQSDLKSCQDAFPFLRDMRIYPGAENFVSPEFLTALDQGCVLTLNGSRYLLVEFPPILPFGQIKTAVEKILATGYTPIVAHPERYGAIQKDPLRVEQLRKRGCVSQVNSDSIRGGSGSRAKQCSKTLLQSGLIDVIASDGHRLSWRPPTLGRVLRRLEERYGKEDIMDWLEENPGRILANKRLESAVTS